MKVQKKSSSERGNRTRILIVDDYPVIREGLTQIINRQPDLLVCAEAGSVREAVKAVKIQKIDLMLVDMLLDKITGVHVIKKVKALCNDIIALVFSVSDNTQYVKQAIEAGARGYITKDEISECIVNAIRQILKGQIYISRRLLENLPKEELEGLLAGKA